MKEKIIIFIVGLLLGSIISTASIYVYTVANKGNNNDMKQFENMNFQNNQGMDRTLPEGFNGNEMPNDNRRGA